MNRRFVTLDVFTGTRYAGNPLAVVLESEGLDDDAMKAIAREFNLSETVFVFPPDDPAYRARLRIFTPAAELPFAGHPTVGTAVLLARLDAASAGEIILEEKIGPVRCRIEPIDEHRGRARFSLPRLPQPVAGALDATAIAAALGVAADEIGGDGLVPARWSAGLPLAFVPLRGRDAVARCRPDASHWEAAFGAEPAGAYVFCREPAEPGHDFHARMFAPSLGVAEDPATGSAAAALAGMIAAAPGLADGWHEFTIEQGFEMGRPSLIRLTLDMRDGRLAAATVGGEAVVVSAGRIEA